jgi:hypothetical protein
MLLLKAAGMPSTSQRQHNLMAMVANDPKAAKKTGIPQSVGEEFVQADKGRKFGGSRPDLQRVNKPKTLHGKSALFKEGGEVKESKAMMKKEIGFMKAKGAPKSMIKHEMKEAGMKKMASGGFVRAADGVASKGKTKAKQITMKKGGKC